MTFDRRLRAYSIDTSLAFLLLILTIFSIYDLEFKDSLKYTILLGLYLGVYIIPNLISPGQTFGKRVQKIRVIYNKDYQGKDYIVPSRLILIFRELVKAALTIFSFGFYLFIGGIMSTNRRDGRTLHDFIFKTRVIPLTRYSNENTERFVSKQMKETLRGTNYND